jgi:hypothetical protein
VSFLAPAGLALFGLAAPLVLLYLLKKKREDRVVSSTVLWEKVIADLEARHPFQRLRANLLLLLELLALAALALALGRPAVRAVLAGRRAVALVLDVSASMEARDGPGGKTRFLAAKEAVRAALAGLRPGDRAMLVLAGRTARTAKALTGDREELLRALAPVAAEDVRGELRDAILLAAAALRPENGAGEIEVFGDGGGARDLPDPAALGAALRFHVFGSGGENCGITGIDLSRLSPRGGAPGAVEVFATVENAGARPAERWLELYEGDRLVATRALSIEPGHETAATFREALAPGRVTLRLAPKREGIDEDVLAADDRAFAVLAPPAPLGVAVFGPGHVVLDRALRAARDVDVLVGPAEALFRDPRVGLCIFDGETPEALPARPCLVFGARGALPGVTVGDEVEGPRITGWEHDHPLLRFVDLGSVEIAKARPLALDGPGRVLIHSDRGPLAVESRARRDLLVAIGIDIRESTWAGSEAESFVIFLLNVLKAARREGPGLAPPRIATGETLSVRLEAGEATLTPPSGGGAPLSRRARAGRADFLETGRAGFYHVAAGGREEDVAVNLCDREETRCAPRTELATGGGPIRATAPRVATREVWRLFALLALLALLAEWWVFHRRL